VRGPLVAAQGRDLILRCRLAGGRNLDRCPVNDSDHLASEWSCCSCARWRADFSTVELTTADYARMADLVNLLP
jgi:hypothetical protein